MNPELDWLKRWNQLSPQAMALVNGETLEEWSYQDLYLKAQKIAQRLNQLGIHKGDRVAMLSKNRLDCFALFFACARLGAILVPINTRLARPEILHILNDSQASLLILESQDHRSFEISALQLDFDQFLLEADRCPPWSFFASELEDPAFILYTSGTTGFPKGALLSHRMLLWNSLTTGLRLNLTQKDCAVIFLPLFHTGGWNVLSLPLLHRGAKVVLLPKFDPERVLQLTQDFRCTLIFGVPTTMQMMSQSPNFPSYSLSHVRYAIVGGEPLPLAQIDLWAKRNIPIRQGYGLTEFGPNVFSLNEEHCISQRGSIGFPNFDVQVKVINSEGQECGPDEIGELWLSGPQAFSGYWNNPLASQECRQGAWVKTGDLVKFNSEGFFFVVGRKKEMYISGGENVYPAEIEKVLQSHPSVRECAVIGYKDPQWGESGAAFIVLQHKDPPNESDLRNYLVSNLAKFKVPKRFIFRSELPKTESGKIKKTQLKISDLEIS